MRILAAVFLIATASPALAAVDAAEDCGAYTLLDKPAGEVVVSKAEGGLSFVAPGYDVWFTLDDVPGESFRWAKPDADSLGAARVEWEGPNLIMSFAEPVDLEGEEVTTMPTNLTRTVFVPYCPGA